MIYGINNNPYQGTVQADNKGKDKQPTPIEQISDFKQTLWKKIVNGETEEKFQIGANEMTVKEWDKLIERMDHTIDEIKEGIREQNEQDMEEAAGREAMEKLRENTCFFDERTI